MHNSDRCCLAHEPSMSPKGLLYGMNRAWAECDWRFGGRGRWGEVKGAGNRSPATQFLQVLSHGCPHS